jgi:hypothetical protein
MIFVAENHGNIVIAQCVECWHCNYGLLMFQHYVANIFNWNLLVIAIVVKVRDNELRVFD